MSSPEDSPDLNVLVFAASKRGNSLNKKLASLAARVAEDLEANVDLASMDEFDVPLYDGDLESDAGIPDGARELRRRLLDSDAFILASPEYNGSVPGTIKNLVDWTSRFRPQPFDEHHGLLMSASPSMAGGNRGLWALRVPLEHLGARIFPDMFSLAKAHENFDEDGTIANPGLQERFEDNIEAFLSLAEAATHYPCIRKEWVEFLGEPPGEGADRVDPPADSTAPSDG